MARRLGDRLPILSRSLFVSLFYVVSSFPLPLHMGQDSGKREKDKNVRHLHVSFCN